MGPSPVMLHASAVAVDGKGALILGASGRGKSSLAFGMMALGAQLVSDDQTCLVPEGAGVTLSAPPAIAGMIEARGVGLLNAPHASAPLALVVDLDHEEAERLPPWRAREILGQRFACVHKCMTPLFPAMLVHYLRYGRRE